LWLSELAEKLTALSNGVQEFQFSVRREGRCKAFKEEPMKSLSELADIYEKWATANEATAEEILASLDSAPDYVRRTAQPET